MSRTTTTSKKNSLLIFIIWPFFALYYAIGNYKAGWAKDIIWFFVVFYGLTITIHNYGAEETSDANRYRDRFTEMADTKISFDNVTALFYNQESQTLDIIEPIILFAVSRITDNFHFLFAVFGLIFGYFYSRNIWYLIEKVPKKIDSANIPVILTFALVVGFWNIGGFRFWTATMIFLYGALPFLYEGRKKSLPFCFLAGLVHFSYLLPLVILFIHFFAGRRTKPFFILFVISLFIKQLDLAQVNDFLTSNLPDIFIPRVKSYTNQEYADRVSTTLANANWYARIYNDVLKWTIITFLIMIFFQGQKFIKRFQNFENLFSFTLLFYSVANLFSLVPSGGRFLSLANLFAMAVIFFYIQFGTRGRGIKRLIFFASPCLMLFSIVSIRIGMENMGFFSVFGNPIMNIFIDVDFTVLEAFKGVLNF
jgi:hypothetical protein